jgi:hypothetical protein
LPEENFTAIVLANASPPPPGLDPVLLAHELAQLYLWKKLPPRPQAAVVKIGGELLKAYSGRYDYGIGILTVDAESERLFAQLTGQPRFEIFPKSETEFFWKVVEAEVKFVRNDKGEVIQAVHRQGGQTIEAPKLPSVEEVKVDPKLLEAYAGRYDYSEGKGKIILTVTLEGGRLYAQLTGQPRFEIFPKSETEFFWKVVNAQVTFVKDENGRVAKAIHEHGGRKFEAPRME